MAAVRLLLVAESIEINDNPVGRAQARLDNLREVLRPTADSSRSTSGDAWRDTRKISRFVRTSLCYPKGG